MPAPRREGARHLSSTRRFGWLTTCRLRDEILRFDVVFLHPRYGWVKRRYRYDAFSDVLYYNGQRLMREEDVLDLLIRSRTSPPRRSILSSRTAANPRPRPLHIR